MEKVIVTIDGPAGTGKSTVSRAVADLLGLPHLDTGAFYRAATLMALRGGHALHDEMALSMAIKGTIFDQVEDSMLLDGVNVSAEIRSEKVSNSVSQVSAHPAVRAALVEHQRRWVELHGGEAVVEGRDIGSVVFPQAPLKIYLYASPEVRAARRARETGQEIEEVLQQQERRDHLDSTRSTSPLVVPEGAELIDTSQLEVEQVVDHIVGIAGSRFG